MHNDIAAAENSAGKSLPPMSPALVLLFACASALSVANVYYAQPLLDALAAEFNIGIGAIGSVITVTQIGSALALLLLVPLGDKMERRKLMLLQLAALILLLIGVANALTPLALLVGMLAVGMLGTAMTQGLIAYSATAASPGERGRVVGAAQGGVVIGLLLARVLAGLIADIAGWRAVYIVSACLMSAMAILLWRTLPRQVQVAEPLSYPYLLLSMVSLLRQDRILQIRGMLALLMFAVFNIFWSALVLLLSEPPYQFSHATIGAFGLFGVVGALAAARSGHWADRGLGQWTTGVALLLLLASWLPLSLALASLYWLVFGIIILDLAGQAIHVTNQSMIFSTHSEAHSRLVGCYMLFYCIGSGLGAITTTATYAVAGWPGVCLLGAVLSLLALAFWVGSLRLMPVMVNVPQP